MVTKALSLNVEAFVTENEAKEQDARFVVPDDDSLMVELTRLPFPEEAVVKKEKASKELPYDPANPWASAPQSLIKAAARHVFHEFGAFLCASSWAGFFRGTFLSWLDVVGPPCELRNYSGGV